MHNTFYSDVLAWPKESHYTIATGTVLGNNYKNTNTVVLLSQLESAEFFAVISSWVPLEGSAKWRCTAVRHQNISMSRLSAKGVRLTSVKNTDCLLLRLLKNLAVLFFVYFRRLPSILIKDVVSARTLII